MDSKKNFDNFVKEFKEKFMNNKDFNRKEVLEFMENYKYNYPEKLERKNGSWRWLLKDPPVWFIFHCVLRELRKKLTNQEVTIEKYFFNWLYDKKYENILFLLFYSLTYLNCDDFNFELLIGEARRNSKNKIKLGSFLYEKGRILHFPLDTDKTLYQIKHPLFTQLFMHIKNKKEITCLN